MNDKKIALIHANLLPLFLFDLPSTILEELLSIRRCQDFEDLLY